MASDQPVLTRAEIAGQLLGAASVERLRTEARRNRNWTPVYKGFRPESLTRAIFIRNAHIFARNSDLLTDLCRVFLNSQGVPADWQMAERFAEAAGYNTLPEDLRRLCELLAHVDVLTLPLGGADLSEIKRPRELGMERASNVAPDDTPVAEGSQSEAAVNTTKPVGPSSPLLRNVVELEWSFPNDDVTLAHQAVTLFERSLVAFVERQLESLHGPAWLKKGCGDLRKRWQKKAAEHERAFSTSASPSPRTLLGYADLGELREIIVRRDNWTAFSTYFKGKDKDWFTAEFQRILPLRRGEAHPGQREVFLVEENAALAAMVDIASRYHLETAERIDALFRSIVAFSPAEPESPESRISSNLGEFSKPDVIGREAELRQLQDFWDDDYARVMSITGEGGVGKTALIEEFTYRLMTKPTDRESRPDPEAIVYLTAKDNYLANMKRAPSSRQFRTLRRIYEATLETVGGDAPIEEDMTKLRREVLSLAHSTRILFALDNLESLTDTEYEEIGNFLDEVPAPSKVILTTRVQRRSGHSITLEGLPAPDAREFLLSRLATWSIELTDEDSPRIDDLVSYTNGVPLALVYCANAIHNGRTVEDTVGAIRGRIFLDLLEFSFESSLKQLDVSALRVLLFLALSKHARTRRDLLQVVADDSQLDDVLRLLKAMSFTKPSWEQKKQMRFVVENPLLRDYVKKRVPEVLPQDQYALVLRRAQVLPADAESPSVAVEVQRALIEAKSQDWPKAIETLEKARQMWGEDPTLLAELGYYYYRTENRAAARTLLRAAISKGHESASTYFHLALVLYYERTFDEALQCVKTALTLKSPFPLADSLAGQLLLAKTRAAALLLDNRTKRALLEEASSHFQSSLIPDERGQRDEDHNRRSREAIQTIEALFSELD